MLVRYNYHITVYKRIMARPRISTPPLDHLRVRVPAKLKSDLETIVSFKETTMSKVLRNQIEEYIERSRKGEDDPLFPNELVKKRLRGEYCVDYIRFQLPAVLKDELQVLIGKRGLILSVLLRLMAEHYVNSNSLQDVLLEFQFQSEKEEAIVVG